MARKSAATMARDALGRLMKEREQAAAKLAKIDSEILELRQVLGIKITEPISSVHGKTPEEIERSLPIQEPPLELPPELAPQDNMGEGRMI